jgi:hypothetical protein
VFLFCHDLRATCSLLYAPDAFVWPFFVLKTAWDLSGMLSLKFPYLLAAMCKTPTIAAITSVPCIIHAQGPFPPDRPHGK